jgi:O-antigen/teichoic acid export membrane protein
LKDISILSNNQIPPLSPTKKLISKNIILTVGINSLGKIASFFVTLLLARIFAPEVIGIIGFANAISGIAFLVLKFGLENYLLREISQNPQLANQFYHKTLTLNLFSIVISSIIFILLSLVLIDSVIELKIIVIIFLSVVLNVITEISIVYYKALFYVIYEVYLRLFNQFSLLLVILPLIYFTQDLDLYLISILLLALIRTLVSLSILKYKFRFKFIRTRLMDSLSLIKDTYRFALLSVIVFLTVQLDIIMVKTLIGNEGAGFYKMAAIFYLPFTIIPGSMMGVILPLLSKYKNKTDKFSLIQNKTYHWLALLATFIIYSISYFVPPFINIFFSGKYDFSIPVVSVLVWALLPYYLSMLSGYVLIAKGRENEILKINTFALFISLFSNIIFISFFGLLGAAIATITTISAIWIMTLFRLKHYSLQYKKSVKIFLFLVLSFINFYLYQIIELNTVVNYLLCILTLIVISFFTNFITKEDIVIFKELFINERINSKR